MSRTVSFTSMAEGTKEDYELLEEMEAEYVKTLPDRVLEELEKLKNSFAGYQVPSASRRRTTLPFSIPLPGARG